jgi:hypothetical protein
VSLKSRPYIGTWQLNSQTLVRHTPDCIVYINGFTEFATCATCNKPLNLQKYITDVSVEATVDAVSTANFSLKVPREESDVFSYDGTYVLQPNLEVVILLRGYFPMKGYAGQGQDNENAGLGQSENFDANEVPVYPYYQVFRGVVTEVTHEYSGGFYSASVQCANLLHFWQYLKLSVNGSVFGKRPNKSQVEPHLIGHRFTDANPYSIIYTLVKVGFGAAYGVDFTLQKSSNVEANDDDNRRSLYKHAAEWWEKRWTEHSGNLRMYGINGKVFNALEQAYLGRWYDTRGSNRTGDTDSRANAFFVTAKRVMKGLDGANDFNINRAQEILENARELGYDPLAVNASIVAKTDGNGQPTFATEDVLRMFAFALDIGKMGSPNMFETEYMSKQEIVEAVKTITGYEFYQDVDGDLVFKPPMYNLDTRSDPVYRIEDRDLISLSESEGEPEATLMKGTGSVFANITGHGMDGWLGVGGVFIDYRLVAKYGYREDSFESNYMNSKQALFISAINRLDLANAGVKSASITIPIRPELRPGYPVYIEHLDCFYYVKSLSHSFAFGGQCTTSINGIAKRAKWLPPMASQGGEGLPSIDQVRLDAPNEYPSQPLYAYPGYLNGDSTDTESSGPPRILGFPNVILALDAEKVNLDTVDVGAGALTAEAYIDIALASGFLERAPERGEGTLFLRAGNESGQYITVAEIEQQWRDAREALAAGEQIPNPNSVLGQIIQFIDKRTSGGIDTPDAKNLITYLSLQTSLKSLFSPGTTTAGKYRYYSSNHPDPNHQAPPNLLVDQETQEVLQTTEGAPDEPFNKSVLTIRDVGGGRGVRLVEEQVKRSVRIAVFSDKEIQEDRKSIVPEIKTQNVRTGDIRFVTFGPQVTKKEYQISRVSSGWSKGANFALNQKAITASFASLLGARATNDPSLPVGERFDAEYTRLLETVDSYAEELGFSNDADVIEARAEIEDTTKALAAAAGKDATQTASALFNFKTDFPAVKSLSIEYAEALWGYVDTVTQVAKLSKTFGESFDKFMDIRKKWLDAFTEGSTRLDDSDPGRIFFVSPDYVPTPDWTPIFPVSDSGGYEVYGNLPYGRGVDIELYANLIASTNSGAREDSATDTAANSETLVGTRGGSNAASLNAIEEFFAGILVGLTPEQSLGRLENADQNAVLATLNTTRENVAGAVQTLLNQDTSQGAKVRNSPVTSFFRGQATFGDTAARNLANLDVDGAICACKGVEANFLLQAFSEQFVDRYPEDPVQGFLEEISFNTTESWQAARDAMAGRTLDTRFTTLAEQFEQQGRAISDSVTGLVQGLEGAVNPEDQG